MQKAKLPIITNNHEGHVIASKGVEFLPLVAADFEVITGNLSVPVREAVCLRAADELLFLSSI